MNVRLKSRSRGFISPKKRRSGTVNKLSTALSDFHFSVSDGSKPISALPYGGLPNGPSSTHPSVITATSVLQQSSLPVSSGHSYPSHPTNEDVQAHSYNFKEDGGSDRKPDSNSENSPTSYDRAMAEVQQMQQHSHETSMIVSGGSTSSFPVLQHHMMVGSEGSARLAGST